MSVVTHWKKRKRHWRKTYHSMLETSVPRKYQKIWEEANKQTNKQKQVEKLQQHSKYANPMHFNYPNH